LGNFDGISAVTGDLDVYGKLYVAFNGSGVAVGSDSGAGPTLHRMKTHVH
jgi:hypothetical protein